MWTSLNIIHWISVILTLVCLLETAHSEDEFGTGSSLRRIKRQTLKEFIDRVKKANPVGTTKAPTATTTRKKVQTLPGGIQDGGLKEGRKENKTDPWVTNLKPHNIADIPGDLFMKKEYDLNKQVGYQYIGSHIPQNGRNPLLAEIAARYPGVEADEFEGGYNPQMVPDGNGTYPVQFRGEMEFENEMENEGPIFNAKGELIQGQPGIPELGGMNPYGEGMGGYPGISVNLKPLDVYKGFDHVKFSGADIFNSKVSAKVPDKPKDTVLNSKTGTDIFGSPSSKKISSSSKNTGKPSASKQIARPSESKQTGERPTQSKATDGRPLHGTAAKQIGANPEQESTPNQQGLPNRENSETSRNKNVQKSTQVSKDIETETEEIENSRPTNVVPAEHVGPHASAAFGIVLGVLLAMIFVIAPIVFCLYHRQQKKVAKENQKPTRFLNGNIDNGIMEAMLMSEIGREMATVQKKDSSVYSGKGKQKAKRTYSSGMATPTMSDFEGGLYSSAMLP